MCHDTLVSHMMNHDTTVSHSVCQNTTVSHSMCHNTTVSHSMCHNTTVSHSMCHNTIVSHTMCHNTFVSHLVYRDITVSHFMCHNRIMCHNTTVSHSMCHNTIAEVTTVAKIVAEKHGISVYIHYSCHSSFTHKWKAGIHGLSSCLFQLFYSCIGLINVISMSSMYIYVVNLQSQYLTVNPYKASWYVLSNEYKLYKVYNVRYICECFWSQLFKVTLCRPIPLVQELGWARP